jgi:hypothetical protein
MALRIPKDFSNFFVVLCRYTPVEDLFMRLTHRLEHAKSRSLDDEEQEEVRAALNAGISVSQLARDYDVSRVTIRRVDGRLS